MAKGDSAGRSLHPYVACEGDHIPKIAARLGISPEAIWDHQENRALKELRKDMFILCPGDVVYVPKDQRKFLPVTIGSENHFTAKPWTIPVTVLFEQGGKPLSGEACVVHGMPAPNEFTTDGEGKLSLRVPVTVDQIEIELLKSGFVRQVLVGHLDPIESLAGVYQRLRNLCILEADGPIPDDLSAASLAVPVSDFQKAEKIPVTGEIDGATRAKLVSVHGS